MDVVRNRLRQFYVESFAKMLKARITTKNSILYMVQGGESKVIARFSASVSADMAGKLLESCKEKVIQMMADEEMAKLDSAAEVVSNTSEKPVETELPSMDI